MQIVEWRNAIVATISFVAHTHTHILYSLSNEKCERVGVDSKNWEICQR